VLGGFLALLAAATFALNNASVRRGVLSGSVSQAMAITVPIGVPVFLITATAFGSLGMVAKFSARAVLYLSCAGVLHFVWGRYCNYRATKAMGAVLVAPVQQASLIFALGLAMVILGETLTPLRAIGIVLVIVGPALTLPSKKAISAKAAESLPEPQSVGAAAVPKSGAKDAFKPKYMEGYVFAFLSSTGYGLSPVLVRLGVEHSGIGASAAGGVISYGAATLAFALVLLWPGQLRHVLGVAPGAAKWFTISGVFVGLSQMLRYMALAVAPVSVVTPIQRLSILFRIYFGRMLNREHEVFGSAVILGTIVSLLGALALSVSTEAVLALLPLPDFVVAAARWHWP
jgi:uncharacterized membrane protein